MGLAAEPRWRGRKQGDAAATVELPGARHRGESSGGEFLTPVAAAVGAAQVSKLFANLQIAAARSLKLRKSLQIAKNGSF